MKNPHEPSLKPAGDSLKHTWDLIKTRGRLDEKPAGDFIENPHETS